MATDKPRFSITVSDDIYQQINDYQHEHRLPTQTKAVIAFIEKGLEVIQKEKKIPTGIIEVTELGSEEGEKSLSTSKPALRDELAKEVSRLTENLSDEQKDFFLALLRLTAARNQGLPAADLVAAGEVALKSEHRNQT